MRKETEMGEKKTQEQYQIFIIPSKFLRRPHIFLEINGCIVNFNHEPWTNLTLPPHLYLINEDSKGPVPPIVNMSENRNGRN